MRAAELGRAYLELNADGHRLFLETLADVFDVDKHMVDNAVSLYTQAEDDAARRVAEAQLRRSLVPPRVRLLTQFNALPEGVKFLVDLRADLLVLSRPGPALAGLDKDLKELLTSWFDIGFLDLRAITWESPAALLEKLIDYEAVHQIQSWEDLRNRLESDRRCYALFHPRMPEEPLAFVEVALVKGIARGIQDLLDQDAPVADPQSADTAIFYSISNTQKGLKGVSFGDYLIKKVVANLSAELLGLKTFATLSPIPGFRHWMRRADPQILSSAFTEQEQAGVRALGGSDDTAQALEVILSRPDWQGDSVVCAALKAPLLGLCARYMMEKRPDGRPIDSVARFHLKNGARMEHLNWFGDTSIKGSEQSAGMMINYRYIQDDIERNHEAYMKDGRIAMSSEFKALVRSSRDAGNSPFRRLGIG